MISIMNTFGVWLAAFFTLCIFSFLYQDNPFYKFAEQVFVGLSAAYWLVYIIYSIMVPNLFAKLAADFSGNIILLIPAALGLMMLMRIHPKTQWISRYPIAIMVGTTAGISMLRYMKSDILQQLTATMINPFAADTTPEVIGNLLMIIGTICGVVLLLLQQETGGRLQGCLQGRYLVSDGELWRYLRLHCDGTYFTIDRPSGFPLGRLVTSDKIRNEYATITPTFYRDCKALPAAHSSL